MINLQERKARLQQRLKVLGYTIECAKSDEEARRLSDKCGRIRRSIRSIETQICAQNRKLREAGG